MSVERLREPVTLPLSDGTTVCVRPIRPDDAPRLQALQARLSPDSIYLRWLSARTELPAAEAAQLADVDYVTRMAYVAAIGQAETELVIGVARYGLVRPDDPEEAEAAVVVQDDFQRRGLGWALLGRLMRYASAMGVHTLVAEISAANARMLRFLERGGLPVTRRLEGGAWQIRMDISSVTASQDAP